MHPSSVSQLFRHRITGPEEWTVTECMRILRRRKATLLWITCMGAFGAVLVTGVQSRVYQSRAALEIQPFNENFLDMSDVYPTAASSVDAGLSMQTEAELLQQDSLIEQVARRLHLEGRAEFQPTPAFLRKLRQDIRIVPLRNSRVIQIVCDARDGPLAAYLANTLAQIFIEQGIETRQRAARQTYEALRARIEELRHGLLRQEVRALSGQRTLTSVTREVAASRRFYEAMLQKANHAQLASVVRPSNIRLIGPAEPAARPYKPNLPLSLIIGALGGFVLAIGRVMLLEQSTSLLHWPGELGAYLALPELGAIPSEGTWRPSGMAFFKLRHGKPRVERAVLVERSSHLSESLRTTLVSILSAARNGDHPNSFVVTSSRPTEGKTTVVSNLGIALAESGSQVLLIDGNMRRPQLHKMFDQANDWGLSDVLREKNAIDELPLDALVKQTAVPNLCLLPSGVFAGNIFGLLQSCSLSKLLTRFREAFDYVLVDAPPCLEFADARNIARFTDGLMLVVRANYTDRKTVRAAVERVESDGIRLTGVILNGWDPCS